MRISCQVCSTVYEVPDAALAAGRSVRCAKCGHQWVPLAAAPRGPLRQLRAGAEAGAATSARARLAAEALTDAPPLPAAPSARLAPMAPIRSASLSESDAAPETPVRRRAGAAVWLGWAVSLAVWVLVVWAAYTYRAQVMEAWPPSQRLYAAVGLGPGS
jgi:predicted Zn finger-like uncharacterized protein